MDITEIRVDYKPPIGNIVLRCDEHVNLFIGPNASGKSTILRLVMEASSIEPQLDGEFLNVFWGYEEQEPVGGFSLFYLDADWADDVEDYDEIPAIVDLLPFLYIPATRVNLPAQGTSPGYEAVFDTHSGIFYGQHVQSAIDGFRDRMDLDRSRQTQLRRALEVGYSCAKRICREVIHDDTPHPYSDISGRYRAVHYGMGIGTCDNIDEILDEPALYAGVLSSGTQGTLLWIYALALKMVSHYKWQEGWEEQPAILLIDEIENHLHPTWQRRVIPALLDHFPKLQIFATTHSPFVVAGLKAGQVHLLNRDENGVVTATTNEQDVVGWTADEILRTMMGVTDPTDDDTAKAAAELRELRNELPRADEQEEEERQQRIQELRQRVNRDLLAGGPMAAQRELFQQNLAEILEEHRRSQNLSQD